MKGHETGNRARTGVAYGTLRDGTYLCVKSCTGVEQTGREFAASVSGGMWVVAIRTDVWLSRIVRVIGRVMMLSVS